MADINALLPENLTESRISSLLKASATGKPRAPRAVNAFNLPRRRAAVLIPFTRVNDRWHLQFIRRTEQERDRHGGQVAYPGGSADDSDENIFATALREAREEIGLQPADVRVLGTLEDAISISNFHVTPVVGVFSSPYTFTTQADEVARTFSIPLDWLAREENHEFRFRQVDGREPWPVVYFERFDGELLWGFTADLTLRLIEVLRSPS